MGQRILQICHSDGDVKLDEVQIRDGELSMDGVLEVQLLYLTADDSSPVGASTEVLPFHMTAQVPGITEDSVYQMEPGTGADLCRDGWAATAWRSRRR